MCHTYCDMGPQFLWSHPEGRHSHPTVGFEPAIQGSSNLLVVGLTMWRVLLLILKSINRLLLKTLMLF
jgi:hypothetical protein